MTETDISALMRDMRDLADRIIDAEGENNNGEVGRIIDMYDAADTTFKAENILLVLNAFEAERLRATASDSRLHEVSVHCANVEAELAELREKLAKPVVLGGRFKPGISKVELFKGSPVMVLDATGGWLNRTGVIVALNAAGFTVKGE